MLRLTQEHVDRALRIARWYGRRTRRAELSDLESAALEGLAKAARDWDPQRALRRKRPAGYKRSFWTFACTKILGEMRDELRRLDHLTRDQRAMVTEAPTGELAIEDEGLSWINPHEPLPLDATLMTADGENTQPIVDLIEGLGIRSTTSSCVTHFAVQGRICASESGSSSSNGSSRASRIQSLPRHST